VLLIASVLAIHVDGDNYRIETVKESSGWNSQGFEHVVEYEWKGSSPITRDVCMRTPFALRSGSSAELLTKTTSTESSSVDVVDYDSIEVGSGCGRAYQKIVSWNHANGTNITNSYCYDREEEITGGYRFFVDDEQSSVSFVDVTSSFAHYALGGQQYYCVEGMTWQPGEVKTLRYRYRDADFSSFKWDALFGDMQEQRVDQLCELY
jgi:hypothetical protein